MACVLSKEKNCLLFLTPFHFSALPGFHSALHCYKLKVLLAAASVPMHTPWVIQSVGNSIHCTHRKDKNVGVTGAAAEGRSCKEVEAVDLGGKGGL